MRYIAGALYGLVAAAHTAGAVQVAMTGVLIAGGTVAALFAVEGIVKDAVRRRDACPRE